MDLIKGIASLLVIISILVVAHEWGHYIVAKLFGMRVEDFSLFFGKVLVRLGVRNGTEFNIRSIPGGGFVKIAGMDPDDISGGRPVLEAIRDPLFNDPDSIEKILKDLDIDSGGIDSSKISDSLRKTVQFAIGLEGKLTPIGLDELQALKRSPQINTDEHRLLDLVLAAHERATDPGLYSQKPLYQRALVIFAGPLASLLFGYLVFCVMGMTIGLGGDKTTNQVIVMPGDPARKAGMLTGDRIVAINGVPTPDGISLVEKIHDGLGSRLRLTIDRGGRTVELFVTPRPGERPDIKDGKVVLKDGKPVIKTVGLIGVMPDSVRERHDMWTSIVLGTYYTRTTVTQLIGGLFSRKVRENVGGPIAMGQMATAVQRLGIAHLCEMAGAFSISLGVINLMPIPILDGGHLLLLGIEKVRRRKLSPREVRRAQMVGLGILALLVCFVMYNDIARTIGGKAIQ